MRRRSLAALALALACAAAVACFAVAWWIASPSVRAPVLARSGDVADRALEARDGAPASPGASDASAGPRNDADDAALDPAAHRAPADEREPIGAGARVRGRVTLEGLPVAGARVEVRGPSPWWASDLEEIQADLLDRPEELDVFLPRLDAARTEQDGSFALGGEVHGRRTFLLVAVHAGHQILRLLELRPRAELDLGELRLPSAGRIVGTVVDERERLGVRSLRVRARVLDTADPARPRWESTAPVDPAGAFALDAVPAGMVGLTLETDDFPELAVSDVVVPSGTTVPIELRYAGRDLADAIWVRFHAPGDPAHTIPLTEGPARDHVRLVGVDAPLRSPIHYRGVLLFRHVLPGTYELVVDDPSFVPARVGGLEPGRGVSVAIAGSSVLRLVARDAEKGAPVRAYAAHLVRQESREGPRTTHELQREEEPPPAGGTYHGLTPDWDTLLVSAEGLGCTRVALGEWEAGTARSIEVVLGVRRRIAGRVLDEKGRGLASEVIVRAVPLPQSRAGALDWRRMHTWIARAGDSMEGDLARYPVVARGRSGADGSFVVDGVLGGHWIVSAAAGTRHSSTEHVETTSGDVTHVRISTSATVTLRGRIVFPDAETASAARAVIVVPNEDWSRIDEALAAARVLPLADDGSFGSDALPPGEYEAALMMDESNEIELGEIHLDPGMSQDHVFDLTTEPAATDD